MKLNYKAICVVYKISVDEMSKKLGITSTRSHWLAMEKVKMTARELQKICEITGINVQDVEVGK